MMVMMVMMVMMRAGQGRGGVHTVGGEGRWQVVCRVPRSTIRDASGLRGRHRLFSVLPLSLSVCLRSASISS
jgi:hypothetical protein